MLLRALLQSSIHVTCSAAKRSVRTTPMIRQIAKSRPVSPKQGGFSMQRQYSSEFGEHAGKVTEGG
jgi:hypothetical protein